MVAESVVLTQCYCILEEKDSILLKYLISDCAWLKSSTTILKKTFIWKTDYLKIVTGTGGYGICQRRSQLEF